MDLIKLKAELDLPAYDTLNDTQARDALNLVNISQDRSSMSREEVVQNIDATELNALTDVQLSQLLVVLSDNIDPFGLAQPVFVNVFGGGSVTISALQAARVTTISKATEIGVGYVNEGDVKHARALP